VIVVDQAVFIAIPDQLDEITDAGFSKRPEFMDGHRADTQIESRSNFFAVHSLCKQKEDFKLASSEHCVRGKVVMADRGFGHCVSDIF